MKKFDWYPLLFSLAFVAVIGCAKPLAPKYINFENIRVRKLGMSESIVAADIKYYNPNNFGLQLKSADLDVYFNEKFVGRSSLDTLIGISKKDTFFLPVAMKVNVKDLIKNAVQLLLNPEILIKVTGNARLGKGGVFKNFPINYEGKQRLDVLLSDSAIRNILQ